MEWPETLTQMMFRNKYTTRIKSITEYYLGTNGTELHNTYSISNARSGMQWSIAIPIANILFPPVTLGLLLIIGFARKVQKKIDMIISLIRQN